MAEEPAKMNDFDRITLMAAILRSQNCIPCTYKWVDRKDAHGRENGYAEKIEPVLNDYIAEAHAICKAANDYKPPEDDE